MTSYATCSYCKYRRRSASGHHQTSRGASVHHSNNTQFAPQQHSSVGVPPAPGLSMAMLPRFPPQTAATSPFNVLEYITHLKGGHYASRGPIHHVQTAVSRATQSRCNAVHQRFSAQCSRRPARRRPAGRVVPAFVVASDVKAKPRPMLDVSLR